MKKFINLSSLDEKLPTSTNSNVVSTSHCWGRDLEDCFEEQMNPSLPSIPQAISEIPQSIRFMTNYYMQEWWAGRVTTFDPFYHNVATPNQKGPPIGGIGSGCIIRSWTGDFTRWHILKSGWNQNGLVPADAFSVRTKRPSGLTGATVLSCSKENPRTGLEHWQWWNSEKQKHPKAGKGKMPEPFEDMQATYHSLYPRSWYVYRQQRNELRLTCRQFSPIIPHNYQETSYPVGVFVWTADNLSQTEPIEVSIMFTFQNGTGQPMDQLGGHHNSEFGQQGAYKGVNLHHFTHNTKQFHDNPNKCDTLTFALAAREQEDAQVTCVPYFEITSKSDTTALWKEFETTGSLTEMQQGCKLPQSVSIKGQKIGAALCIKITVPPGARKEVAFSLAWDMPVIRFGDTAHYRRYTKHWDVSGNNAHTIAAQAFSQYQTWEADIEQWQNTIIKKKSLPKWYKSALFNELYYIVDGATTWTNGMIVKDPNDPEQAKLAAQHQEHFAYLEGHEYNMFNTYDVHFYASHALIYNWPKIQQSLQRDFARAVMTEHPEERKWLSTGAINMRKKKGSLPHDLGTMDECPWIMTNAYNLQDTNRWKDLNSEFILSVYRDYYFANDKQFLEQMWDAVETVFHYHKKFDKDGDGVIENEGFPDSTYDNWVTTGLSCFSGLLWLSALSAGVEMAQLLGKTQAHDEMKDMLTRGVKAYEDKLWSEKGQYYLYDLSKSSHCDSIMADQMQGHQFSQSCGLPVLLNRDRIRAALRKVLELNVRKFHLLTSLRGAVNGMRPSGNLDMSSMQAHEVWTGTTYTLAAAMIYEGMRKEAFETAEGVYKTSWGKLGFWFQTPEAYDEKGGFRSCAYMRPLAIWSMQVAMDRVSAAKKMKKKLAAASTSAEKQEEITQSVEKQEETTQTVEQQ